MPTPDLADLDAFVTIARAGGFRNAQNFTTAIYFHCGGLDLYPR